MTSSAADLWMRIAAPLLGRRGRRGWPFAGVFLPLALIPFLFGVAALFLVDVVVDPYDLRPWGLTPQLASHIYPDNERPLLINAMTSHTFDTAVLGASSVMAVMPDEVSQAFADTHGVLNLSYTMAAPADTRETFFILERKPGLKHVIIAVDYTQMLPMVDAFPAAKMRKNVLSSTWAHAGDFNLLTALASLNRLVSGVYDLPSWRKLLWPDFLTSHDRLKPSMAASPGQKAQYAAKIAGQGSDVLGRPDARPCSAFPFLDQVLAPALARLSARGVTVDILLPPNALVGYYNSRGWLWMEREFNTTPFQPGPVFPQVMRFRRCTVETAEPFGKLVHVSAMDNDLAISNDLANYMDPDHLLNRQSYQRMLAHIAAGDSRLTVANFDSYEQALAANVLSLRLVPPGGLADGRATPSRTLAR